jgi:carbonic anhydrase/acetyltransferase-like protein (isoleucine patch superfamily)
MIRSWKGIWPTVDPSAWIADTAVVIGDVTVGAESSVWYGSVVRGDVHRIRIGARTNVQDLSVLHVTRDRFSLTLGDDVTVGHRVILHGARLGNRILVGMGAIVMDGADLGDDVIVGAGSLVTEGTVIPPGHLAFGSPCRIRRELNAEEREWIRESSRHYALYRLEHRRSESREFP